jgi:hypothetical protein
MITSVGLRLPVPVYGPFGGGIGFRHRNTCDRNQE